MRMDLSIQLKLNSCLIIISGIIVFKLLKGGNFMLDFIKKHCYELMVTFVYTLLACLVYGIWSYSAWELWYVSVIIVIVILLIGVVCGYLWISIKNKKTQD